ncbi:MAG: glycosyltransferase family 2 protein [Leptolyngbya sp. ERB_1_1]
MSLPSVAAYITAYEDAEALKVCVNALLLQTASIERIFVVDNSRQPLPLEPHTKIQVFHHPENIGIAAGIRLSIAYAIDEGYDFLWMFDQDSQPTSTCLALLLEAYTALVVDCDIGIVAPHAIDARTGETVEPARFLGDRFKGYKAPSQIEPFECDAPITSGSLLWLKTTEQVRSPDPRLFIDGVDLDYGLRLRRAGFRNFVIPKALMYHRFGEPLTVRFAGRKKTIQLYSALRHYYICRNHTYLEFSYAEGCHRITCGLRRIVYAIKISMIILLFDPIAKFEKIKACMIGTYYGFRGNLDRPWK